LIGLVLLVGVINFAVFRNMYKLAKHLNPSRLSITEAIFGVMLAALAVQSMVDGLAELVIITAVAH
jgi:multiple antibiotic resistance protein